MQTGAEFFDVYYRVTEPEQRAEMIADEPPMPIDWLGTSPWIGLHVYLGGIIEHLAHRAGIIPPKWIYNKSRYYSEPVYPTNIDVSSDEKKAYFRQRSLPELALRNNFACSELHMRGMSRYHDAFDPARTEERREKQRRIRHPRTRAARLVLVANYEEMSKEEQELRREIANQVINHGAVLEEELARRGVTADDLGLDLSPSKPFFKLPEDYGRMPKAG